jgi:disulfide bond formation protein DsbB
MNISNNINKFYKHFYVRYKIFRDPYRLTQSFLLLCAIFAIVGALFTEYLLHVQPCYLCKLQRVGYYSMIVFAIFGFLLEKFFNKLKLKKFITYVLIILCLLTAFIALYNVAVEQHIVPDFLLTKCASHGKTMNDVSSELDNLMNSTFIPCDKPSFTFFKLSLAAWNFLYAIIVVILSIMMLRFLKRHHSSKNGSLF